VTRTYWRPRLLPITGLAVAALALAGCSAGDLRSGDGEGDGQTLTFLVDNTEASQSLAEGLKKGFEAANEGVTVEIESRPGGAEGDNIVKTRLSTGDMTDVFMYNTGSLFQQLDPAKNMVPLDDAAGLDDVQDTFLETVKNGEDYYGAPFGTAVGGGILYNRKVYDDLGLQVPKTWDEFMANNEKIKAEGIAPVIQTYQDTWTSQLLVLADFHNVATSDPQWADKYTKNQVKYSDEPAVNGFEHLQEVQEAGFLNEDFASATLDDGLAMLAKGEGAHYPILTFTLGGLYSAFPEAEDDIGFFGEPGEDASKAGATIWTGGGVYIPTSTEGDKLDLAKKFVAFAASSEGCDAQTEAYTPTGPYFVEGCTLPDDLPQAVQDVAAYLEQDGATTPALEFLSPVKGPALEQITVEVGSGISTADKGAALYDEDVKKQAQQLGLPGWS
jgi:raffinose/stachyose/melibiose transport system substrate-binding protein